MLGLVLEIRLGLGLGPTLGLGLRLEVIITNCLGLEVMATVMVMMRAHREGHMTIYGHIPWSDDHIWVYYMVMHGIHEMCACRRGVQPRDRVI